MLQQLHASQVLQEQACHRRWQDACEAWRTLRSRHAVQEFCQHIKHELAEPPERLRLFSELRDSQQEAHSQFVRLCGRLQQLVPPQLTAQSVAKWVAEAKQWGSNWQQQLDKQLLDLQQHEAELSNTVSLPAQHTCAVQSCAEAETYGCCLSASICATTVPALPRISRPAACVI